MAHVKLRVRERDISLIKDVGGVDNLHYPENNGTTFDLNEIAE